VSESRSNVARPPTAARVPALENAQTITLSAEESASVETIAARLPDPATLASRTLVVVPDARPTLARAFLSVFGGGKRVPRSLRCSALVARGYVDVGAARDDDRNDLAWGYAP
jgi:hypothetical protein